MNSSEEQVRAAIAAQAGQWFVANDERPLDSQESAALVAWLKASPAHVEEFLGVSVIARDLGKACDDPGFSIEALLARARADDDTSSPSFWRKARETLAVASLRWQRVAATVAAIAVLALGALLVRNLWPVARAPVPPAAAAVRFETRHGEQQTYRLADNSVVHLNTDTTVTVRYGATERVVVLGSGEAFFEVAHEGDRPFRVFAGAAEVVDVGTRFDVRLEEHSTLVTVSEGQVAVGMPAAASSSQDPLAGFVRVSAGEQIVVAEGERPTAVPADVDRTTAWLRRQILFDHEPLDLVAAEFNRYSRKPIEITTPALRSLRVSGVFATDNTAAFIAFLRTLEGVHVEVTATRILVSQD
ncbi:MAG TPA: FecR domain-containing protein [Steroidobacteraceae bacterium]|nr:FecR domain-containing protein [Steroidobacteraceae bacterium]